MTLIINNDNVRSALTMAETIAERERDLLRSEAVRRPYMDIQIPIPGCRQTCQWGTMEGGSTGGYFAIRMKSDVIT